MKRQTVVLHNGIYFKRSFKEIYRLISEYQHHCPAKELPDKDWLLSNIRKDYLGVFYDPPGWTIFYFKDAEDAFLFNLKY